MAVSIPINAIILAKCGSYAFGQAGINTYYYQLTGVTGTQPTTLDIALGLDNTFAPLMKPLMHNQASYYGVSVQVVQPLPPSIPQVSAVNVGVGTNGTTPLPGQTSGIITKQTNSAGKRFRGRVYIPFPSNTANLSTTNAPSSAYVTLLSNLMNAVLVPLVITYGGNTANLAPVIYHGSGQPTTAITSARANQKWATQRRRGNYGKTNVYPPF